MFHYRIVVRKIVTPKLYLFLFNLKGTRKNRKKKQRKICGNIQKPYKMV